MPGGRNEVETTMDPCIVNPPGPLGTLLLAKILVVLIANILQSRFPTVFEQCNKVWFNIGI